MSLIRFLIYTLIATSNIAFANSNIKTMDGYIYQKGLGFYLSKAPYSNQSEYLIKWRTKKIPITLCLSTSNHFCKTSQVKYNKIETINGINVISEVELIN